MPPHQSGFTSSHITHLWNDIVGEEDKGYFSSKDFLYWDNISFSLYRLQQGRNRREQGIDGLLN